MPPAMLTPAIHHTKGFTLVELAIVLVIIGLIIGGVLASQQVMQNARITNAISGIQSFQAAFQSYNQNFGALPGDDLSALTRFGNELALGKGNGDGLIGTADLNETYNVPVTESALGKVESVYVWAHLRAANLIKGAPNPASQPANPFNGIYGIQNGAFSNGIPVGTSVVCLNRVPGTAALAIDTRLDDGEPDTGAMRAGTGLTNETAAESYVQGSNYVVCTAL